MAGAGPAYDGGRPTAVNVATGDQSAVADFPGRGAYRLPAIGGNPVRIGWYLASAGVSAPSWWENATGPETATKVNVPKSGSKRLDLTVG